MNLIITQRFARVCLLSILLLNIAPSLYAQEEGADQQIRELRDANAIIVTMKNGKQEAFTVNSVFIEQLDSSNLRKELEIVPQQIEKIEKAKNDTFEKAVKIIRDWKKSGETTPASEVQESLFEIADSPAALPAR
ncbi:hypothetical protein N9061_02495 [bacterium]|nr:hypothetical protein [Mariniblastus sp.]MDB4483993.1 hypothetical protein [bacterium]